MNGKAVAIEGQPGPAVILVVDDEPDLELIVRQRFRRQVRANQLRFVFARNGIEALQRLREDRGIQIVLTDINMPEMDGLTLLVKLNELDLLLKSVIISAYGDMENIRAAMNRGASDFLVKPIDLEDLEITVRKTLDQLAVLRQALRDHDQLLALRHELDVAASIQRSILPRVFPAFPERHDFDVFAAMIPATEVGGDFYDFFLVDDSHLGLVIADVSGKGVPAALFMAVSRTLLKATALDGAAPGECLQRVNARLCADNANQMFVTTFYGLLDLKTGTLTYSNGGHNPPYVVRRDGTALPLPPSGGMALGVLETATYPGAAVVLQPDDALVLYTDGVTEAMDCDGSVFSAARLGPLLAEYPRRAAADIVEGVIDAVRRHTGDAAQSDDLTTLVLAFHGPR